MEWHAYGNTLLGSCKLSLASQLYTQLYTPFPLGDVPESMCPAAKGEDRVMPSGLYSDSTIDLLSELAGFTHRPSTGLTKNRVRKSGAQRSSVSNLGYILLSSPV